MKHKYIFFAAAAFIFSAVNFIYSQCTGCTITISTTTSIGQIVNAGTTLCITSTGNLTGGVYINGGTVCNSGTISSPVAMTSGTLNNYGTISTNAVGITGGTASNSGVIDVDSIALYPSGITFTNSGKIVANRFGIDDASGSGTINFTNTNTGVIVVDTLGVQGDFTNNGSVKVNVDFAHYDGTYNNNGGMSVGRDFGNFSPGTFHTECVIAVGRDWGNTGTITGKVSGGCSGFSVAGVSGNSGAFGTNNSFLDLCDAGSPPGGFDGNLGTTGTNVTHCSCTNACIVASGIAQTVNTKSVRVYPNPVIENVIIDTEGFKNGFDAEIYDLTGRKIISEKTSGKHLVLNMGQFKAGIYFYKIVSEGKIIKTGKLIAE